MENETNKKVRKTRHIKTSESDYFFHLHEAPETTLAKTDLLCFAQKEENQVGIEKIKIKMLSKSCENFEPWQFERKTSFENEPQQIVITANKEDDPNNSIKKRSFILNKTKLSFKSEIGLDKIKKCTSLKFEGKPESQKINKKNHKNMENRTSSSFYSLRKMMNYNSTPNPHKFSTELNLTTLKSNRKILSKTMRSEVKSKKKFSNNSDIIEIEHPLTSYTKIQRQMMGTTLRKKLSKNRESNLLSLKNTSINVCQAILLKKKNPIQTEISKIIKLILKEKTVLE